jgi:hypothetical protein
MVHFRVCSKKATKIIEFQAKNAANPALNAQFFVRCSSSGLLQNPHRFGLFLRHEDRKTSALALHQAESMPSRK